MSEFGINPGHAVAGFSGGLASLPFMSTATKIAALGAILAGTVTAIYLTPVLAEALVHFFQWRLSEAAERGLAFIVGLTAMLFIPFILGAVRWCSANVSKLMERITGVSTKPPEGGA